MRNLDWRWRITCRYKLCDQNGNFLKFKTAHGCHFENSFIYISQPWIIRFRSYLVGRCELCIPRMDIWPKNRNFANSKWRTDAILKMVFQIYLDAILAELQKNLERWCRITWRHRSRDQSSNFQKFKMMDRRHLEISFISISAANHPISIKFGTQVRISICKFKIAVGCHIDF